MAAFAIEVCTAEGPRNFGAAGGAVIGPATAAMVQSALSWDLFDSRQLPLLRSTTGN